jgi:hypothetical protein
MTVAQINKQCFLILFRELQTSIDVLCQEHFRVSHGFERLTLASLCNNGKYIIWELIFCNRGIKHGQDMTMRRQQESD